MPSTRDSVDIPSEAATVAQRYQRIERPVSYAVAGLAGIVGAAAVFVLPLVQALLVVAAVLVLLRFPVFRYNGRVELVTDTAPDAVRADFESMSPPVLAFQWGLADTVRPTEDGGSYEVSYLFGLRSVTMTTEVRPLPSADDLELVVTADGQPWATYTVSIRDLDGTTGVDIEWVSDRRFGLRRIPQRLVAKWYRDEALTVQGYTVVERNDSVYL